jgi:N-acetylated-alpha-linked acidic dipeptidase
MKIFIVLILSASVAFADDPIRGFPASEWQAQREREKKAAAVADPVRIKGYIQRMSREPHHAGSADSKAVAEYALGLFREWGYDAKIEVFEALLPYPTHRSLELTGKYKAKLEEPKLDPDPDSGDAGQLPTYNAYSASGTVTAPLIYVNYGIPEDYDLLEKQGISVKGKIVIARYGKSWRGTKPKVAQEHGAIGCLIYSDPRDDGYFQGDVYPKGPFRPPQGAQRGSVMDMPLYVGDPLSPGWASEPGSKRLSRDEAQSLMKIPVIPISYGDAQPLLESMEGKVVPEPWRGALPLTYHFGPSSAPVRLSLDFDWKTRPIYNVIARMNGSRLPDEWVIYGNHHDAWVNGAHDPVSGAAALLESARSLSELRKQGWSPKRTIVFALWDAEEFGLIGSTEWVEKHAAELARKAVAYVNSDTNGKGKLGTGGSHGLEQFLREVARDNSDPVSGKSLLETARARGTEEKEFRLGPLGAGSDYVAFLHHAGIPSLNLGFAGDDNGGVYHSIYDSYAWYSKFSDSDFVYGKTLAQVMSSILLRISEASILPSDYRGTAGAVKTYLEEIQKLAGKNESKLDFTAVKKELAGVEQSAAAYDSELRRVLAGSVADAAVQPVNAVLLQTERALTTEKGLPNREWYKHQLYAPGTYTGYSAKTLPVVREAVEAGRWQDANAGAAAVAQALRALNARLDEATRLLKGI